ncbi:MAG: M20/M25/M40 family metallo-hydrolase, partial [Bacteroidota bacterium]
MGEVALNILYGKAVELLVRLISVRSFSREEEEAAAVIRGFFTENGIDFQQHLNNTWAVNRHFDGLKPTILLNSHIDTVRPNAGYTLDPFSAIEKDGRLYGLGSNDAGGCLVSLIAAFLHFYDTPDLLFNLVLAATAEEEISGRNGVESILPLLGSIDCAIVGEPTLLQMAVAEKGLLVIDFEARGKSGHAARDEGENAIYKAMSDIAWLTGYTFEKVSPFLGPVKLTVTQINAGT